MIFFWDKNVPKTIPLALRTLRPPFCNKIYFERYPLSDNYKESGDDVWLPEAGQHGWVVLTHDWKLHINEAERRAIRDFDVGVFYLWGAQAPKWEFYACLRNVTTALFIGPKPPLVHSFIVLAALALSLALIFNRVCKRYNYQARYRRHSFTSCGVGLPIRSTRVFEMWQERHRLWRLESSYSEPPSSKGLIWSTSSRPALPHFAQVQPSRSSTLRRTLPHGLRLGRLPARQLTRPAPGTAQWQS